MSRFVLITPNSDFERRVRMATAGMQGSLQYFQADYLPQGPEEVLGQLLGEPPEVFVLGPGLPAEDALKFAAVMDLQYPEISMILVASESSDVAIQAMRAGIRDLLDPTADVDHIRIIVERASLASAGRRRGLAPSSSEHHEHAEGGRIIAVISPKGGVGKTTVATNIAVGLGKIAPMGVVIVDLDLQFGDVASGLMLEPEHTITDAVVGARTQWSSRRTSQCIQLEYTHSVHRRTRWKWTGSVEKTLATCCPSCGRSSNMSWWTLHRDSANMSWPLLSSLPTPSGSVAWMCRVSGDSVPATKFSPSSICCLKGVTSY